MCGTPLQSTSIGADIQMKVMKSVPGGVTIHWSRDEESVTLNRLQIDSVTDSDFGVYKVEIKQEGATLLTIHNHLYRNGKVMVVLASSPG